MKKILTHEWSYSLDGEQYYGGCASREETIEECKESHVDIDEFYVGQCVKHIFTKSDCDTFADSILEMMDEKLGDECGEWSEAWLGSITREQEQELDDLLSDVIVDWLNRNNLQPSCFTIQNAELINIDKEIKNANEL